MSEASEKIDVRMRVTEEDAARAASTVTRHGLSSKAQAVSESLSLTNFIGEAVKEQGARVLLEYPDGRRKRVVKLELGLV